MAMDIKLYPDKFCRTCLRESVEMRPLSGTIEGESKTLLDALHFVANINVFIENSLPKQVCSECEAILRSADGFKRRCLESEGVLTRLFEFSTSGQLIDNLSNNQEIKDEKHFPVPFLDSFQEAETSVPRKKSSKRPISSIFNSTSKSDVKITIFPQIIEDSKSKIEVNFVKEEQDFDDAYDDIGLADDIAPDEETFSEEKPIIEEITVFSCSCGTVFNNKDDYRLHLFKKCTGTTKSRKVLVKKKKKVEDRNFFCPACNSEFKNDKLLKTHMKKHENDDASKEKRIFECTFCLRTFSRKSSWSNHMRNHNEKNNSKKFICETCKREYQHKAHLDNHILAAHSRDKGFSCEICTTNFTTQETLDLHRESHNVEKKHQCEVCKKSFIMLSTLNDHMRVHTGEKPFLCSVCGRGFSQKTNLAQHLKRHQGLKAFKCEDCDRSFVSKGELVAHNRKHSGAHPFVCDDCGSGFTTSSSLVKHRRIHTGERPYACDLCPMRFAATGTLKNHRRTHTGEKPFQCSLCEKAFVQKHDLVAHMRGHTGERPYVCDCGQAFRKASALKAHARLHGKEGSQRDLTLLQPPPLLLGSMGHPPV